MNIVLAVFTFIFIWVLTWVIVIIFRYYKNLLLYWNEPILKHPVLIFESDDWGPGDDAHAQALEDIGKILSKYTDSEGRHPVMTLGVVMAVPDLKKITDAEYKQYHASFLKESTYTLVRSAMLNGLSAGVFDLQLHGLEHYWPGNLMTAMQKDAEIIRCLESTPCPVIEKIPSELQSRWIDTTQLPSKPLNVEQIKEAVEREVDEFAITFGFKPKVVVPPTFVWNAVVENEWSKHSLQYLVTPGCCNVARDKNGKPSVFGDFIYNGKKSESGLIYIVRNDFFEPSLGHTAEMAIASLCKKSQEAQPTLLEIHRFNFIQSEKQKEKALRELEQCIVMALAAFPDLKFLSTFELAELYASNKGSSLLEKKTRKKIAVFLVRILANSAIRKWLTISGLILPVFGLIKFFKQV